MKTEKKQGKIDEINNFFENSYFKISFPHMRSLQTKQLENPHFEAFYCFFLPREIRLQCIYVEGLIQLEINSDLECSEFFLPIVEYQKRTFLLDQIDSREGTERSPDGEKKLIDK